MALVQPHSPTDVQFLTANSELHVVSAINTSLYGPQKYLQLASVFMFALSIYMRGKAFTLLSIEKKKNSMDILV